MPNVKDILHMRNPFTHNKDDEVCIPKNLNEKNASPPAPPAPAPPTVAQDSMAAPASAMASSEAPLTVVELFQSQGCNSCPPANANVIPLADQPDKLVLTYEVTYWDYLGWPDTFGNKEWDTRQRDYSFAFKNRSVYTPQVIVNGVANGVGSRKSELASLLEQGASAVPTPLPVSVSAGTVTVGARPGTRGIVQLIRYDPRNQVVDIGRGENRGEHLPHRNIVRELHVLGWWEGAELSFAIPEMTAQDGLSAAILVQKGRGGQILGAAKV